MEAGLNRPIAIALVTLLLGAATTHTEPDQPTAAAPPKSAAKGATRPDARPNPAAKVALGPISEAEQIAQLERTIEADRKELAKLQAERNDPDSEYARAEAEFRMADDALEQKAKTLKTLRAAGKAAEAKALEAEIAAMRKTWKLLKDRFDIEIDERKTLGEQITTLEQKIRRDSQALAELTGSADPAPSPAPPAAEKPSAPKPADAALPPLPPEPSSAKTPAPAATPPPAASPAQEATAEGKKPTSTELLKAQEDARTKEKASQKAEQEAREITGRLETLDRDIALEKKLLETAKKKHDNASEAADALNDEFRKRSQAGAPQAEINERVRRLRDAERLVDQAEAEVKERTGRLDDLQTERAGLQAQQIVALKRAAQAHQQAEVAEAAIKELENPFNPRNVLRWLFEHGPRIVAILAAMLGAHGLSRLFSRRVVRLMARAGLRGRERGTREEREARAHTLVGVFHNAATIAVLVGGALMILQESGIPIAPLLGGAAVFGLAVAFGAQNLIRDYFYGFVILVENQFKLNDVVKIGDVSGQVEGITLRMTVLRDTEGSVHFIPNGQITAVTNMTHGWSRALFEIGVAYKEDIDRVMGVLVALGKELRQDPAVGPGILDDPTMLGVDSLGESAVVIKFYIKTRPLQQWPVKREMLRRIKNKFDDLGIEIPYPHRTVYHRHDPGAAAPESPPESHAHRWTGVRRPSA
jgi:moderate conductance mechanosensitive channel